jgi:hypothetical protein
LRGNIIFGIKQKAKANSFYMPAIWTDIWGAIVIIGIILLFARYSFSEIQAKFDALIERVGSPRKFLLLSIIVIFILLIAAALDQHLNDHIDVH